MQLEADVRPITDRERELMAWRATIDPVRQPDAVRAKIAELTDAEVRYYTSYKDRANFLKLWMKARAEDLPRDEGNYIILNDETRGLFELGHPLSDGRYLHHNG